MGKKQTEIIRDYTTGSVPGQLLRFSLPFMLSNALQVLYSMADMVVVGRVIGSAGLAAVATASQIFLFLTVLGLGFSTGGQVYISQLVGAGRRDLLPRTIGTLFAAAGVLGAAATALGLVLRVPVLRLLNVPPEAWDMASAYMLVSSCGVGFTYGYNAASAILRGMGDSRHPLGFIAAASAVNGVLDVLFVAVWGWGTAGAALATILGQAVSFFSALIFLYRRRETLGFDFRPRSFRPDREALRVLARLGVPFALQSCAINLSMMFVSGLVNAAGVVTAAAFGVGVRIDDIANKITQGLTYAGSAMVGQNFAAREPGRVRRTVSWCWLFSAAAYAAFTALLLLRGEALFALFTDDAAVVGRADVFVRTIVWSFPALVLLRGTVGLIQGVGNARLSLVLSLLDGFVLRMLLSWLLGVRLGLGLEGFFWGYGMATYGTALPAALYFCSGGWEKRRPAAEKAQPAP